MQRTSTLACLLFAGTIASAQPVLTHASNAPVPGTSYTMHYSPYVSPGPGGANQHWDLSALQTDSTNLIQLVPPETTEQGSSFPGATVSETGAVATMYFRTTNDGMYFVGSDADLVIVNSDEATYLPFPCTYQTTWTDDFSSEFSSDGMPVSRTGDITGVVDGYGSVTMPSGTETDVLRIHWHEETVDSTGFFTLLSVYDSHLFYAVGQPYPLVQLVTASVTFMGQTTTTTYAQWVDEVSTDIPDDARAAAPMDVYPVPTSGSLNFTWPSKLSGRPLIMITDAEGRTVRGLPHVRLSDRGGQVDLSGLVPGIYRMMVIDELGNSAARSFIVQ